MCVSGWCADPIPASRMVDAGGDSSTPWWWGAERELIARGAKAVQSSPPGPGSSRVFYPAGRQRFQPGGPLPSVQVFPAWWDAKPVWNQALVSWTGLVMSAKPSVELLSLLI